MAAAPWSVKGIDPKAREVAKDLARRSGMTLGEWLNRVILEDDLPEEVFSQAHFAERPQHFHTDAAAFSRPLPEDNTAFGRVARALDRLTDRIEASETRTGFAIAGVEHSVRQAVARIDIAERVQAEAGLRPQAAEFADADPIGPRSVDALRMMEAAAPRAPDIAADEVMERLGRRLAEAEAHTAERLDMLGASLAGLGRRLEAVEGDEAGDLEQRLEAMGAQLARRVETAREEFAQRLQAVGADSAEARLAALTQQVEAAEQRSARAVEAMGREVLNLVESFTRRLQASEARGAEAIAQVGGEAARIASAVEERLTYADQVQAQALERLSEDMTRLTDRLTERLLGSERRAAQAIDDVGEQMSRVTERFERRQDRASAELDERIRQSEARTAKLLETGGRPVGAWPSSVPVPRPLDPMAAEFPTEPEPLPTPLGLAAMPAAAIHDLDASEAFAPIPEASPPEDLASEDSAPPTYDETPFALAAAVEPEEMDIPRPLSTREVIDQARAAARAAQTPPIHFGEPGGESAPAPRRGFFGGGLKRRRPSTTLQTALMVAGGAAFLSVGAAGVVLLEGPTPEAQAHAPRAAMALESQASLPASVQPASMAVAPTSAADQGQLADRYADVLDDLRAGRPGALASLKAVADADYPVAQLFLAKLYEKGEAGVVVNPAEARRWTVRAAENGDASAMHQLAVYDFRGEGGPANLAGAADWFRKAAELGVVDSQYNLALLYRSGSGVQRDLAQAYRWFSAAAAAGDAPSRAAALELKAQLTPAELAQAEQAAAAAPAVVIETPESISGAQRRLAALGYFKGAASGVNSPDFKAAVAAWQRDHALAATGALDPGTASRLTVASR